MSVSFLFELCNSTDFMFICSKISINTAVNTWQHVFCLIICVGIFLLNYTVNPWYFFFLTVHLRQKKFCFEFFKQEKFFFFLLIEHKYMCSKDLLISTMILHLPSCQKKKKIITLKHHSTLLAFSSKLKCFFFAFFFNICNLFFYR